MNEVWTSHRHRNELKMDQKPNPKRKNYTLSEENIGINLCDPPELGNGFLYKLKARLRKNRCIVHQILIYVLQRAMSRERKCNPQDGRKYHTSNKKLISRIC